MAPITLHISQTPYSGDILALCQYLCPPQGHILTPNNSIGGRLCYPTEPNPLRNRLAAERKSPTCRFQYIDNKGFVAYTQSVQQYRDGRFCYYLYDHLKRPIETGEASITHIKTGDVTEVKQMTYEAIKDHVLSLDNRTNVMVAVYDDENPFPIAADADCWWTHLADKIATVYYYPHINAGDTCTASGAYHTSLPWYTSRYHYSAERKISASHYQCSQSSPVADACPQPENKITATVATCQQALHATPVQSAFPAAFAGGILYNTPGAIPWRIPVFVPTASHSGHPCATIQDALPASSTTSTSTYYHWQHVFAYSILSIPAATTPIPAAHCRSSTAYNYCPPAYGHSPPVFLL